MIHAMQQIKVPRLAIPLAQFSDALGTRIVRLYFGGAVLLTGRLEGGKMIDYLLFRLYIIDVISSTCPARAFIICIYRMAPAPREEKSTGGNEKERGKRG